MERRIVFSLGEYYHVYNRGIEKRNIFQTEADWKRFQKLLYLANGTKPYVFRSVKDQPIADINTGEKRVAIGAYVLMPNHFHILIRETREGGLSAFMEKLATGYSKYFNMVNKRVGPLFQSRFKARHVDQDEYLKYLFAYIHLNPVKLIDSDWKENGILDKEKALAYLRGYQYSSFADLTGEMRPERAILTPEEFPGYFDAPLHFEDFLKDWLAFKDEEALDNEAEERKKDGIQDVLI